MNRPLLLLPLLAMFLMACPQKHTTSSATPPKPDPNAYNTQQPVQTNQATVSGQNDGYGTTVYGDVTNSGNVSHSDSAAADSANHVVGKPNGHFDTTRLVVSFLSKGDGIDHAAKTNLDKWLSKHEDVKYSVMQYGREGETRYCFAMKYRGAREQVLLINDIKTAIGNSDRVFMTENVVCDHVHELAVTSPQVVEETVVPESRPDSVAVNTTRLVVSFISKGEGIDHAAKGNLDKWLSKHKDVKYTVMQKGREGEVKYCFTMKDRKDASQVALINEIKTVIGTSDRVLYAEKVVCDHVHELATDSPQVVEETIVPTSRPDTTSNTARLVVSFTSKGEGIDHTTKEEFEKWLNERNVVWETKTFGREGETNFCFRLENKDARQQEIFVRDVRTYLTGKETVFVEEYAPCDKRK